MALLLALGSGCAGIRASSVPHCAVSNELPNSKEVDWQLVAAHRSGDYPDLLSYFDHLEAFCLSVNVARGDKNPL